MNPGAIEVVTLRAAFVWGEGVGEGLMRRGMGVISTICGRGGG